MSECFVSPKNKITEILSHSFKTKLENLEKLVCTANSEEFQKARVILEHEISRII